MIKLQNKSLVLCQIEDHVGRIDWDGKGKSVKGVQDDMHGRLCRLVWCSGQGTRGVSKSSTSLQGQSLQKVNCWMKDIGYRSFFSLITICLPFTLFYFPHWLWIFDVRSKGFDLTLSSQRDFGARAGGGCFYMVFQYLAII